MSVQPYAPALELAHRADDGAREWIALMAPAVELAKHIANTQFVKPGLRGRPDAIVAAILYGDEIGLGPMQALAKISMIDGNPSLSSEGERGLILARGHKLWIVETTETRAVVAGQRAGDDRVVEITWTIEMARRAKLAGKTNWTNYPKQMLLARAFSDLARFHFADVLGGFPITEEYGEDVGVGSSSPGTDDGEAGAPTSVKTRRRRRSSPTPAPSASASPSPAEEPPTPGEATDTPEVETPPEPPDSPDEDDSPAREVEEEQKLEDALEELEAEGLIEAIEGDFDAQAEAQGDAAVAKLAAQAEASSREPDLMTDPQRRKMQAMFRERDVTSREARLEYCSHVARRTLASSNELTVEEAGRVIDNLEQWHPEDPNSKPFIPYDPSTEPFPEGF